MVAIASMAVTTLAVLRSHSPEISSTTKTSPEAATVPEEEAPIVADPDPDIEDSEISPPLATSSAEQAPTLDEEPLPDAEKESEPSREDDGRRSDRISAEIPTIGVGTSAEDIESRLGEPDRRTSDSYWPNTHSVLYELVPNQVTVAYILDKESDRVRQTEASFAQSVDYQIMRSTLDNLLDGRITREIESGLESVRERKSNRYSFSIDGLEGTIERNHQDCIYIGVWDKDLH